MTNDSITAKCSHCGNLCDPNDTSPCKKCGKIGRHVSVVLNETINLSDQIKVSKTREYYEKHPKITGALLVLWLGSIIAGYFLSGTFGAFIGGLIGATSFILPPSTIKIRNTETF